MRRLAILLLGLGLCLGAAAGAEEDKKSAMPEPNLGWEWANFVILVGVLGYVAVKQGGPYFNLRAAEIRKGIDEAKAIKADSDAKIAAINSKLGRLDAEIATLRETAQAERRAAEQRLKDETAREIERIRANAGAEIDSAGKTERIALQKYAAQLALELAETKVRARSSASTEEALVRAFIHDLGAAPTHPQTHN